MYGLWKMCAIVALAPSACAFDVEDVEPEDVELVEVEVEEDPNVEVTGAAAPARDRSIQVPDQAIDVDAVYPPDAWAAPTLLFDGNFPSGVLQFSTAQQFADFYRAFDAANGSEGAASGSTGTTPYSAAGTSSATVNYQTFTIQLGAGQALDLGTCALEGSSFTGDTYLRLFRGGSELAASDDACDGLGSKISHTAEIGGTYEIRMGCYSSGSCSGTVGYSVITPGTSGGLAGARSFSGVRTESATTGFSTILLSLAQGQVIDVGTCGVSGGSFGGDTYLRLIDVQLGGNVEVAASDDACDLGSRITYAVPRGGVYQVRLGCYAGVGCSGVAAYTVTAEPGIDRMLPAGFQSAADLLAGRPPEPADDIIRDVGEDEFALDLKAALTEDDTLGHLVDPDLQILVEGRLHQLTNMGVFQVEPWAIPSYREWLAANSFAIDTDPDFQSIPGEVPAGDGVYQVMPGVTRTVGGWGTPSVKLLGFDEDAGEGGCPECFAGPGTGANAVMGITGVELGRISYWFGKVNLHKHPIGGWEWDSDCVSGANIDPLQYCRKFWPNTASVTPVPVSHKPGNRWQSENCAAAFPGDGQEEWACNSDTPPLPSCNQTPPPINYANYPLSSRFSRKESIGFGNKRFVFKARSPGFDFGFVGFHTIYIKGKIQRKKRFLGIGYWGPSNADEIVVGVENMKLDTDYIVPHPTLYNTLAQPKFNKLAKYKLGSKLLDVASISFNAEVPFRTITQVDLGKWADSALNSLIGNVYTNGWKLIEDHIMDAIDPSFKTRYAAYTKMVDAIDDQFRLRWAIGAAEKGACNAHKNNWTFDTNGGFRLVKNGGVSGPPGTPPAKVNYKYSMRAGSFYGRARVGSSWYGIRFVRQ